jgi:hypothetical protein
MKDTYYSKPGWEPAYDTMVYLSDAYDEAGGNFKSTFDPGNWGTVFRGQEMTDVADAYKAAGGTYYNQFTPAQNAGVPYNAATGEAAPVMNMQTGVPETPQFDATGKVIGQTPTPVGGSGSSHSLSPDVINKMWR